MTTYLMIGGPAHGETMTFGRGERALVPDFPTYADPEVASLDPTSPLPPMVAYSVWDYSSVIKGAPPALPIMKADDTSDEEALAALVAILSPALDAVEERLRAKMHGRAVDEFRSFLDDVRETFPVGAWEARS